MVSKLATVVRMAMTPLCSEKMIHQKTSWNLKGEVRKRRKKRKKTMTRYKLVLSDLKADSVSEISLASILWFSVFCFSVAKSCSSAEFESPATTSWTS